jgi:GNAT superfamily N-acetyltransferase
LIVNGEQAEIEPIVVKSTCRRHGIGRALIDAVIHEANRLNILCLSVKPVARNDEALAFFYESGFRSLGQIELFMWLGASSPCEWKSGLTLLGKSFFY